MNHFYLRMSFLWLLTGFVVVREASAQTPRMVSTTASASAPHSLRNTETQSRIKSSWQLPRTIRKAFDQSRFCNWYIEKMISHRADGKTFYTFYLNNSCMLDGDHYDSFFEKTKLIMTDEGVVVENNVPDYL